MNQENLVPWGVSEDDGDEDDDDDDDDDDEGDDDADNGYVLILQQH